jgi:integrase
MPTHRGKNEGTIRKRVDGRWEARIALDDGERRSFYGKSRQEVARLLAAALHDREQGITALDERQTVGAYLDSWIATYKQRRKLTSYERNERTVRLHLIPGLGKAALAKLTP